ncbi:RNA-dependent RNA polymerase 6 [Hibiscus syriacus]|uniref:RNA-dependent RNA polymerase n=1 Tax=Hibiscus syriacus TaxID=106335 RepID=A0A6A3B096_HIBSY|nr:RNA-dependent RNA polymerase 6 [Hibiscus syriacus]
MESEVNEKDTLVTEVTQVSVGGFDSNARAKDLLEYLENEVGHTSVIQRTDDYKKVDPHAFVHFASPLTVNWVVDAAGRTELVFNNQLLKVSLGPENSNYMNRRRRKSIPFKLPAVSLEIGNMANQDEFFVGWRGPPSGVEFIVDPFDSTFKFCFSMDTAFSFKGTTKHAVIKCDFKVEFLVREINEIKQYTDTSCLVVILRLASSPWVWYRTADDEIEETVPWDLLDDDDQWIRTTDFTHSGAVGCCNTYKVKVRHGLKLKNAMGFLKEQRGAVKDLKEPLRVSDEPGFVRCMSGPFYHIDYKEGIPFETIFLVNAVMHKGIFNQHQLSEEFFNVLRNQSSELNVAALRHIYSDRCPVNDAYERLKVVQSWLLRNPKLFENPKQLDDIVKIRRLVITPTKAYCLPEVELSNRNGSMLLINICNSGSSFNRGLNPDLPDIVRNQYVFSDGIGKITPDLAMEVAQKLKLDLDPPCAYQIRYAGCKGVVACWQGEGDGIRLSLRPSMNKFLSNHTTIEICSWTRFQPGFLNRQIITLLSTLDVPDGVFWEMQNTMVSKLNKILVDTDAAFEILTLSCAEQGNIPAIMLSAGFKPQSEPHLRGILTCVRASQLCGLREKTRIFVPLGRLLMGVLDELGVLEQGQCFIQVSNTSLEKCFLKHGSRGERPHTNEASGSDLDGDNYFVTWEELLIPPRKKSWPPMQYDPGETKLLERPVNHKDIVDFFAKNMVNENLGSICNAHVVHADLSEYGALDEKCTRLAELAATAVDFPKTGKIVSMPAQLKPKSYPDFMGKEEYQSYKSSKILGRLYRNVKDVYDEISESSEIKLDASDINYDADLEVTGSADYIADAWVKKCSYNLQLIGLLGQYKVKREEEVVTGQIWSMPKYSSRKLGDLKEKLNHSYGALRKEFRQIFENMDSDFEQLNEDEKNELYERKASAWYQVTYHPKWVKSTLELQESNGADGMVILSFAWIAADFLCTNKV